ncbi:hypothetical protein [Planomonospora sp. ID82291]|uniref:hypothetical protein n=1 Tax=Planomonospora sp. ID82291 TaxID=2738136 RepID=UPI0018C35524|nr:hypothetical protein [Planomonospora sp. ID82291]MBG0814226.1 hypothetical protein [Planomonospora sp. ID82291]
MRSVHLNGGVFAVTDDPDGVIDVFLGCAVSLEGVSGRPLSVEFAERFSPEGSGMRFPVFGEALELRSSRIRPQQG